MTNSNHVGAVCQGIRNIAACPTQSMKWHLFNENFTQSTATFFGEHGDGFCHI